MRAHLPLRLARPAAFTLRHPGLGNEPSPGGGLGEDRGGGEVVSGEVRGGWVQLVMSRLEKRAQAREPQITV